MSIKWTDATSYSHGERGKIDPTAWECRVEGIRIWVSCRHIYYPGLWVMKCSELGIDMKQVAAIGEVDLQKVMSRALDLAAREARERARRLNEFANACEDQP